MSHPAPQPAPLYDPSRHGRHRWYVRHRGRRARIDGVECPPPFPSTEEARDAYRRAVQLLDAPRGPQWHRTRPYQKFRGALTSARNRAAKRAAESGRPFDLTDHDVEALYRGQEGRCAVSGMAFDMQDVEGSQRKPLAPSIDRIDCSKGYVAGNVRLVLTIVNIAMSDWGEDVFRRVCRAVSRNAR